MDLHWAAELAVSDNRSEAQLGVAQLNTLARSNLNDADVQEFDESALDAVVDATVDEIELRESHGRTVRVMRWRDPTQESGDGAQDLRAIRSENDGNDEGGKS